MQDQSYERPFHGPGGSGCDCSLQQRGPGVIHPLRGAEYIILFFVGLGGRRLEYYETGLKVRNGGKGDFFFLF